MKKLIYIILMLLFVATLTAPFLVSAKTIKTTKEMIKEIEEEKYSTTVQVVVSCDDKDLKTKIESYVKRELRSLGDVTIVEEDAEWIISITALYRTTIMDTKVGFAMSTVFVKPFGKCNWYETIHNSLESNENTLAIAMLESYATQEAGLYRGNILNVGTLERVKSSCEGLVVDFDTGHLEPEEGGVHRDH